jgi:hypothetical protein
MNLSDLTSNIGGLIGIVCGCGAGLIAIGVTGFMMYRMFKGRAQNNALLQNGIAAPAVIVSIEDTGWRINDQPQAKVTLQVTPTDRPPFQAVIKQVFDVFDVGSLTPGAQAQVRFDPNDPSKITIESLGGAMGGGMVAPGMMPGMAAPNNMVPQQLQQSMLVQDQYFAQLRITGTEARAKIVSAVNMNIRNENTSWVFHLTLDVTTPTGEHFQSQTQAAIADASQYKYQPGAEVIIRYDPANKEQVALVRSTVS